MNESRGLSLLFAEKDSTLITNSNSAKLIVETTKYFPVRSLQTCTAPSGERSPNSSQYWWEGCGVQVAI